MFNFFICGRSAIDRKLRNLTLQSNPESSEQQIFEDPETLENWEYLKFKENETDFPVLCRLPGPKASDLAQVLVLHQAETQKKAAALLLDTMPKPESGETLRAELKMQAPYEDAERCRQMINALKLSPLRDELDPKRDEQEQINQLIQA